MNTDHNLVTYFCGDIEMRSRVGARGVLNRSAHRSAGVSNKTEYIQGNYLQIKL